MRKRIKKKKERKKGARLEKEKKEKEIGREREVGKQALPLSKPFLFLYTPKSEVFLIKSKASFSVTQSFNRSLTHGVSNTFSFFLRFGFAMSYSNSLKACLQNTSLLVSAR